MQMLCQNDRPRTQSIKHISTLATKSLAEGRTEATHLLQASFAFEPDRTCTKRLVRATHAAQRPDRS